MLGFGFIYINQTQQYVFKVLIVYCCKIYIVVYLIIFSVRAVLTCAGSMVIYTPLSRLRLVWSSLMHSLS